MSRKKRVWKNQCGDKIRHKTKEAAIYAAMRYRAKFLVWMNVYFCIKCHHWHIGHSRRG
jgi:hypothetical protein